MLEKETDYELKDRLCELIPRGAWHTAEDIGNSSGEDLDALAESLGTVRKGKSMAKKTMTEAEYREALASVRRLWNAHEGTRDFERLELVSKLVEAYEKEHYPILNQREWECYTQGARCGHIEGRGRAGMYVIGEEESLSYEAAANQKLETSSQTDEWARGYRYGYKRAAEGSELEKEFLLSEEDSSEKNGTWEEHLPEPEDR